MRKTVRSACPIASDSSRVLRGRGARRGPLAHPASERRTRAGGGVQAAAAAAMMAAIDRLNAAMSSARRRAPDTFCPVMNVGAVPLVAAAAVATAVVVGDVQSEIMLAFLSLHAAEALAQVVCLLALMPRSGVLTSLVVISRWGHYSESDYSLSHPVNHFACGGLSLARCSGQLQTWPKPHMIASGSAKRTNHQSDKRRSSDVVAGAPSVVSFIDGRTAGFLVVEIQL